MLIRLHNCEGPHRNLSLPVEVGDGEGESIARTVALELVDGDRITQRSGRPIIQIHGLIHQSLTQ